MTGTGSSSETIHLACGGDDRYAMPIAVTLFSVASHLPAGSEAVFHILNGGISPANQTRIERVLANASSSVTVRWLPCSLRRFSGFFKNHEYSEAIYMRLLLPELLPEEIERVLYLDSDTLALRDITPLWQTDIEDVFLSAVQDIFLPYTSIFGHTDLEIPPDLPYFNSGVMLMNLKRFRETDLVDKMMDYLLRYRGDFDQHALNAYVLTKWNRLPYYWNLQTGCLRLKGQPPSELKQQVIAAGRRVYEEAGIVHFTGGNKPWSAALLHPFRPHYHRCLKQSGWMTAEEFRRWTRAWLASAISAVFHARLEPLLRKRRRTVARATDAASP